MLIGIIAVVACVGLFFFLRWFLSPYRRALRKNRRACRRGDTLACAEYERLKEKGEL